MRIAFFVSNICELRNAASLARYLKHDKHDKYILLNHCSFPKTYDPLTFINLDILGCEVVNVHSASDIPDKNFDMTFCTPIYLGSVFDYLGLLDAVIKKKKFGYLVGLSWGWDTLRDAYIQYLKHIDCLVSESPSIINLGRTTREEMSSEKYNLRFNHKMKIVYSHPYYDTRFTLTDRDAIYNKYGIPNNDKKKVVVLESKVKGGPPRARTKRQRGFYETEHISRITEMLQFNGFEVIVSKKLNMPQKSYGIFDVDKVYGLLEMSRVCDAAVITKEGRGIIEITMANKPIYAYKDYMSFNAPGRYTLFHKIINGLTFSGYGELFSEKLKPAPQSNQTWLNQWITTRPEGNIPFLAKELGLE